MRNYNHCRSSDNIWAQEGRLFRCNFLELFFGEFFFSPIGLISFIDPLHQKIAKACCKIDTFLGEILQNLDPRLLPDFPGDPNFFSRF